MANLLVPTFIWYGVPEHSISSILVLPDALTTSSGKTCLMATGSVTGHVCIWDVQRKKQPYSIQPRIFLTCQEPSPVIALLSTSYDWKESLISVTTDGTVAIFSVCDGQCLATRPSSFKCEPTCVRLINSRYLAAGGRTSELEILDLNTRKVVRRIEGHNTWIRSMVSFTFGSTSVLGTLTGSGFIRFWEISEDLFTKPKKLLTSSNNTQQPSQPIIDIPIQEIELEFQDSRTISISPNNTLLLVLCLSKWVVYWVWGKHYKLLMSIPMPNSSAICGHFIDDNTIAIWSKNGFGYIYTIPKQITEEVKTLCQEKNVQTHEEEQNSQNKSLPVIKDLEPGLRLCLTVKGNSVKYLNNANAFCNKELMTVGFDEGYICMWDLPLPQGPEQEQLFPNYVGDFSDGFWPTEPGPHMCHPSGPTVTASLLLETEFSLINGYSDGTVSIRKLPSDDEPIRWVAHDAKVNCILFIRTTTTKTEYIITGSDDFYVKVWSLQTQKLVSRFSCHAGRIRSLHYNSNPGIPHIWKNRFFSVGEDRSVILYQLDSEKGIRCVFGGHPSQICDVKWNVEQDYLIVECTDGSISIWEMETGELEQCLYGKTAVDIFNNANPLSKAEKYEKIKLVNKQAITGITIDGQQIGYSAPVQAIVFNIKLLSAELCKKLQELQNPDSEISMNDLSTFNAYSYLLPWGSDENLEHLVRTELLLKPPSPAVSYGLMGSTGRMGILVPSASQNARWNSSPTLTALHTLSTVSLSKALLPFKNNANACSQILSHVCAIIPEKVIGYVDPSLSFLARYWQDPMEDIMQSSRTIFVSVIDRQSLQARKEIARTWSHFLQSPDDSDSSKKTKSLAVLVLGILGAERPDSLTAEISNQVTMSIMDLLFQEDSEKLRVAAVELLGKGFGEWCKHIKDVNQIIIKLFKLSILPDQKLLTKTAQHALMLIGAREPLQFLRALGRPIHTQGAKGNEVVPTEHALALHTIGALVKKHPVSLLSTLPLLVESVVRSLDPHVPYLRNACLKSATTLVHDLVRRYPMITFHQLSQRLAVGTRDGSILIYDLISATRWFTLEGHKHEVSAVSFEGEGNFLASYSIQDASVKIWRASAGFFGILGSNPSCYKTLPVSPATKVITPSQLLEPMVKLQWTGAKEFILVRLWEDEAQNYVVLKRT